MTWKGRDSIEMYSYQNIHKRENEKKKQQRADYKQQQPNQNIECMCARVHFNAFASLNRYTRGGESSVFSPFIIFLLFSFLHFIFTYKRVFTYVVYDFNI